MINIQENVPLFPRTTFEIGGAARYFVEVESQTDLHEALLWARSKKIPCMVLAGGSNVLIPDEGLDAVVIKIANKKWSVSGERLEAEAGCVLLDCIRSCAILGLGGWEKLAGIPGTIGGAVRGNAGAFGPEMKDFVTRVRSLNAHTFEVREFTNAECAFAYRMSFFKSHPEWIIVNVTLELAKVAAQEGVKMIEETIRDRERRHIQNVRAAGSYFMNPVVPDSIRELFEQEKATQSREGRVPAGWLIEKVGLKGARVGDAVASVQHPNYLKNDGHATARDVKELAQRIKSAVKEQFNVELQEEAAVF